MSFESPSDDPVTHDIFSAGESRDVNRQPGHGDGAEADCYSATPWEDDAGRAVLDGVAADASWEIDAAAAVYDVDDNFRHVPSPAEKAVRGVLEFASDEDRVGYWMNEVLIAQERLPEVPSGIDTPGYLDSVLDHAEVRERYEDARTELTSVMGEPHIERNAWGIVRRTSWHFGSYKMPDGELVPVAILTAVTTREDGSPVDPSYGNAIDVETYSAPDSDDGHANLIVHKGDTINRKCSIKQSDIVVPPLPDLLRTVTGETKYGAHMEVLQPWVERYLALPPPARLPVSRQEKCGVESTPEIVSDLLLAQPDRARNAASAMHFVLDAWSQDNYLVQLMGAPVPDLVERLQYYGVTERFVWLLENAEAIQMEMFDAHVQVINASARPRIIKWRERKDSEIATLEALTDNLKRMAVRTPVQEVATDNTLMQPNNPETAGLIARILRHRNPR